MTTAAAVTLAACTPSAGLGPAPGVDAGTRARADDALAPTDAADFVRNTTAAGELMRLLGRGDVDAVADRFHYPSAVASSEWVDELHERVAADLYVALVGLGAFSKPVLFTDTRELAWIEIHSVNRGYWAALGVRSMYVVTHSVQFDRVGPGFVQIFFHETDGEPEIAWIQFAVDKSEQGLLERALALAPADALDSAVPETHYWAP
jgi:hypothetical protein